MPSLQKFGAWLVAALFWPLVVACSPEQEQVGETASAPAKNKPNIIFIFSDDLSFRDLSAYGQKNYTTPNLDSLASVSVRFTNGYSGAPECAPSRGTMLTGLSVGKQPIRLNSSARGFEPLPAGLYTFPKMLQKAGYTTGVIGKWGLGYKDTTGNPLKQGFDYHYGYLTHYEAHSYFPLRVYENGRTIELPENNELDLYPFYAKDRRKADPNYDGDYDEQGKLARKDVAQGTYAPNLFDQKAVEFIKRHKEEPFLLYFASNLPHGPTIVDDLRQLRDANDMPIYPKEWGAMVQRLDLSVGKIVKTLKEEGLYQDSLIVFASDNGYSIHTPEMNDQGVKVWPEDAYLKNKGPFRGGKFGVLEAGMRIPFFMKLPGQQQPQIVSTPVWLLDLFPTFAELASEPLEQEIEGHSLLPLIEGKADAIPAERFMYFYKRNEQSIRQGPWFAFRHHPAKPVQLFLIEEDPKLQVNLAKLYPEVRERMKHLMDTHHQPSEWYFDPWDSHQSYKAKVEKAKATNQQIKTYRPNHIERMPWEKK